MAKNRTKKRTTPSKKATTTQNEISSPTDLTLQQKFVQALAATDNQFPPDPYLDGFASPTLQETLPTVAAQIDLVQDVELRTNTIALVNVLLERRNDPESIFYRFVKGYVYHATAKTEAEKLHYRYPQGASGLWVRARNQWLADTYGVIEENPMGIRIATVPQAIANSFSRFIYYNILKRYYIHSHPPPTDVQFFVAPLLTFVKALYQSAGLANSIPALTCLQITYTTPRYEIHKLHNVPDRFEKLDSCYIGFTEETDTWPTLCNAGGNTVDTHELDSECLVDATELQRVASENREFFNIDLARYICILNPNMTKDFFRWTIRRCGEKSAEVYTIPRIVSHGKQLGFTHHFTLYSYSFSLPRPNRAIASLQPRSFGGKSMCIDCQRRAGAYQLAQNEAFDTPKPASLAVYPMMRRPGPTLELERLNVDILEWDKWTKKVEENKLSRS